MASVLWPLEGAISSNLNMGGYVFNQYSSMSGSQHCGFDYNAGSGGDADLGRAIIALAPGIVRWKGVSSGYGNHFWYEVDPEWGGGWVNQAHLQSLADVPEVGTRIERGWIIARCGKSGGQTWAHLHKEVKRTRPPYPSYYGQDLLSYQVPQYYFDPVQWAQDMQAHAEQLAQENDEVALSPEQTSLLEIMDAPLYMNRDSVDRLVSAEGAWSEESSKLRVELDSVKAELANAKDEWGKADSAAGAWHEEAQQLKRALGEALDAQAAFSRDVRDLTTANQALSARVAELEAKLGESSKVERVSALAVRVADGQLEVTLERGDGSAVPQA